MTNAEVISNERLALLHDYVEKGAAMEGQELLSVLTELESLRSVSAGVSGDWVLVPRLPTAEMRRAWNSHQHYPCFRDSVSSNQEEEFNGRFVAMLAAAPQPVSAEVVAKRWLIEEKTPSGPIRWQCVEHENHARSIARDAEFPATVSPLYAAPQPTMLLSEDVRKEALRLLRERDERDDKVQDLIEDLREIVLLMPAASRPEGLMKQAQDAVYAMRGRLRVMDDAAIAAALQAHASDPYQTMLVSEDKHSLRKTMERIASEAAFGNNVIAQGQLNSSGQGRTKVATSLHRIERDARAALQASASTSHGGEQTITVKAVWDFFYGEKQGDVTPEEFAEFLSQPLPPIPANGGQGND